MSHDPPFPTSSSPVNRVAGVGASTGSGVKAAESGSAPPLAQRNILVTGGEGFLGRHIVDALRARGVPSERTFVVRHRDFDLTDAAAVDRLFRSAFPTGVDVVIHAAGYVGGISANIREPAKFFHDNMAMALHLIERSVRAGLALRSGRFVLVGTASSYPDAAGVPFREEDLWSGPMHPSGAPYGLAKKAAGAMLEFYRTQHGLASAYLVPINMYGPGDHFDDERAHVIPSLVSRFVRAADERQPVVTCWGTGRATRDFLFVRDAAEAIVRAAERVDDPAPINIGTSRETPVRGAAEIIARCAGFSGRLEWDASRPDGQARRAIAIDRARRLLDWSPATSLEDGLAQTVAWYREHRRTKARP